jgi:hypothetical protein
VRFVLSRNRNAAFMRYLFMPGHRPTTGSHRGGGGRPPGSGESPIRMRRYPTSESIAAAGYSASRHVMRIRYIEGREYDYFDVPPQAYSAFLDAESKGQFVNWHIKPHYDYEEID